MIPDDIFLGCLPWFYFILGLLICLASKLAAFFYLCLAWFWVLFRAVLRDPDKRCSCSPRKLYPPIQAYSARWNIFTMYRLFPAWCSGFSRFLSQLGRDFAFHDTFASDYLFRVQSRFYPVRPSGWSSRTMANTLVLSEFAACFIFFFSI